ncbi:MAG TPA: amidase [Candidatus Xenobia bacterium]|jgi:Asp-tRNA(Asn)/Glu-tRNA(Gln) amidotransferase A subunit family amidase
MILTGASPLADTAAQLRQGDRPLSAWLDEICDRIDALEPQIGALVPEASRRQRLQTEGRQLTERYPDPSSRPPLFGIPVAVKDVFAVDDLPTRAGSRLPSAIFRSPQAHVITALRRAGALVLGKTTMDEFAYCEPSACRNPHALDRTPGGSSAGSAAAVAAAYTPLAIGTQTSRSIIGPAAFCGVVGFKASQGRVPLTGAVPLAPSLDTVGWFTQDLAGAALAASVLLSDAHPPGDLDKPLLAVPSGRFLSWVDAEPLAAFWRTVERLRGAGYQVEEHAWMGDDDLEQVYESALRLTVGEMAEVHKVWFSLYENQYRERTAMAIRKGLAMPPEDVLSARAGQIVFRTLLEQFMAARGIHLWVTPSSRGPAPVGLELTGWGGMTMPWSYAGLPCVSIPGERSTEGLPLGVQFVGRYGRDEDLLRWVGAIAESL